MSRKEQAEKSIEKIVDSAFKVIATNSISGASTAKIAAHAHVSKPLVHYHFKTKEVLLERVLKKVLERLLEIPLENAHRNMKAMDEIKAIFKRYKNAIEAEPDLLVVFYDFWVHGFKEEELKQMIAKRFDAFRVYTAQLVSEGVASGEFGPDKSHMIPPLLLSFLEGASVQLIADSQAFNYDLYQYMALDMIANLTK